MTISDLELARQAVRLGAEVAKHYFRTALTVSTKSNPGDVVTIADRRAEEAIVDLLTSHRPEDGVIGEEGSRQPGSRTWVIDALDGSLNFVHGDPFWCSAVALIENGEVVVSAVYHALSGEIFSAQRGAGTWLCGSRLNIPPDKHLRSSVVSTYLEGDNVSNDVHRRLASGSAGLRIRGSGSLEMAWIAAGRGDAWVARDMQVWDEAPGSLLITEAGGASATWTIGEVSWFVAGSHGVVQDLHDQAYER
jgi:fructose-1,6-bisphosphatase/inositol monophosphatase family enzyme